MRRIGLFFLTVVLVIGVAGCSEDNDRTGGMIYGTDDTPGTSPAPPPKADSSQEVTIAKCLSSKGAVLYGASWCSYTQKQISSFKEGFQYLRYVECTKQDTLCKEKGIAGYPTWIIGGTRIGGYRDPTTIGSAAGCSP